VVEIAMAGRAVIAVAASIILVITLDRAIGIVEAEHLVAADLASINPAATDPAFHQHDRLDR
jgi:hypothetical protein